MILIADSGSTKCRWCLMTANGQSSEFLTDGINPLFQTTDAMRNSVSNQLLPQIGHLLWAGNLTDVFFYGAGCTKEKSPFVQKAIQGVFRKAEVHVFSDMLGAARALLGKEKGVACILGTGSNSCLYDGENMVSNVPSLGYILGDEGSAVALGKRLVSDVMTRQLSDATCDLFLSEYPLTVAEVVEHVYRKPFPNRWLASYAKFCASHLDNPEIRALVEDTFRLFVRRVVSHYFKDGSMQGAPVGFVGSVAYYYKDILRTILLEEGYAIGEVLQEPMDGLKRFHKADLRPTM